MMSKREILATLTARAVLWLGEDATRTQADAARQFGVNESTISRALALRRDKPMCPCCGQVIAAPKH